MRICRRSQPDSPPIEISSAALPKSCCTWAQIPLCDSLQTTSTQQDNHELLVGAHGAEEDPLPVQYPQPTCRYPPILRPPMEFEASPAMSRLF